MDGRKGSNTDGEEETSIAPWSNIAGEPSDGDIVRIYRMKQCIGQLPQEAMNIRGLITRLEICHFKFERHIQIIVQSIGRMEVDLDSDSIGRPHPRSGENAWKMDKTGRSRRGQEYVWILQMWLDGDSQLSEEDQRGIPQDLFQEVYEALGDRDERKETLVSYLLDRLLWRFSDRQQLPKELGKLGLQIDRTDICHYGFPTNVWQTIEAIGKLEPLNDFEGCGSFDEERLQCAQKYFDLLCAWLEREETRVDLGLGERSDVKEWLVACLAKTVKALASLDDDLPLSSVNNQRDHS